MFTCLKSIISIHVLIVSTVWAQSDQQFVILHPAPATVPPPVTVPPLPPITLPSLPPISIPLPPIHIQSPIPQINLGPFSFAAGPTLGINLDENGLGLNAGAGAGVGAGSSALGVDAGAGLGISTQGGGPAQIGVGADAALGVQTRTGALPIESTKSFGELLQHDCNRHKYMNNKNENFGQNLHSFQENYAKNRIN